MYGITSTYFTYFPSYHRYTNNDTFSENSKYPKNHSFLAITDNGPKRGDSKPIMLNHCQCL